MLKLSKYQKIKNLLADGEDVKALGIAKGFFYGFTKAEKRSIDIAYEGSTGKAGFYKSIGIDWEVEKTLAIGILESKFK